MILRKPTRIEIKQEDDFGEYEEYKKKQLEQPRLKISEGKSAPFKGMSMLKEAQKQEPFYSNRTNAGVTQTRNFTRESPDNQLLQNFLRSSLQRGSTSGVESSVRPSNTNPSGGPGQDSSFNYIFNMLLSSASNQDESSLPNIDSFMNLNQSFGNQGSNQDMSDF